ncbi:uncharacterized protein [Engystomops pustulosus]|uniref:uncharacterized protein n=1 Tax=Engystomops pustulosus TaxID=76066 RepID=UPI003AFA2D5E
MRSLWISQLWILAAVFYGAESAAVKSQIKKCPEEPVVKEVQKFGIKVILNFSAESTGDGDEQQSVTGPSRVFVRVFLENAPLIEILISDLQIPGTPPSASVTISKDKSTFKEMNGAGDGETEASALLKPKDGDEQQSVTVFVRVFLETTPLIEILISDLQIPGTPPSASVTISMDKSTFKKMNGAGDGETEASALAEPKVFVRVFLETTPLIEILISDLQIPGTPPSASVTISMDKSTFKKMNGAGDGETEASALAEPKVFVRVFLETTPLIEILISDIQIPGTPPSASVTISMDKSTFKKTNGAGDGETEASALAEPKVFVRVFLETTPLIEILISDIQIPGTPPSASVTISMDKSTFKKTNGAGDGETEASALAEPKVFVRVFLETTPLIEILISDIQIPGTPPSASVTISMDKSTFKKTNGAGDGETEASALAEPKVFVRVFLETTPLIEILISDLQVPGTPPSASVTISMDKSTFKKMNGAGDGETEASALAEPKVFVRVFLETTPLIEILISDLQVPGTPPSASVTISMDKSTFKKMNGAGDGETEASALAEPKVFVRVFLETTPLIEILISDFQIPGTPPSASVTISMDKSTFKKTIKVMDGETVTVNLRDDLED